MSSDTYGVADFFQSSSNQAALTWLRREDWPDRRMAIFGPAGCGKTHLLKIWADHHKATLLFGREVNDLQSLPKQGFLAIDEADRISCPELLLHLLNFTFERDQKVLLAARTPPARWARSLPDLTSRLKAVCAVELEEPDDELLQAILLKALSQRQLSVSPELQGWLLHRIPRSAASVLEAVHRLDVQSLREHRAITRPFAARVLDISSDRGTFLPPRNPETVCEKFGETDLRSPDSRSGSVGETRD